MKKELGDWTSRLNLCRRFSSSGGGLSRSMSFGSTCTTSQQKNPNEKPINIPTPYTKKILPPVADSRRRRDAKRRNKKEPDAQPTMINGKRKSRSTGPERDHLTRQRRIAEGDRRPRTLDLKTLAVKPTGKFKVNRDRMWTVRSHRPARSAGAFLSDLYRVYPGTKSDQFIPTQSIYLAPIKRSYLCCRKNSQNYIHNR